MAHFDAAIIGAGIVGAACAWRLAADGLKVAVIEARGVATGTTAAGMGHIVVMDDSDAQFRLTEYSRRLWNELAPSLPETSEYEFCGTIWVAADSEEMDEVRRKNLYYAERGIGSEILDEKSLHEAEPKLRAGLAGGLLVRQDSVVYQVTAAKFLLEEAARMGAVVISGRRAAGIHESGVTLEDGSEIGSGIVVNAAGLGAAALVRGLPVRSKKGHLVITERYPGFVRHQLVELGYLKSAHASGADSVAFNVQPRATGQMLIGSSRQFDREDAEIDPAILARMTNRAFDFMPELRKVAAVRIWTGLRPATPDNLPVIGRHPFEKNLMIAAGHEGLGITTSLGTAELIADEIAGRRSAIDRTPFSPARFFG